MSNMLADGMTFLASVLKADVSETATYRRGSKSCSIDVTLGSSLLRVSTHGISKVERPTLDVKFTAADLDFSDGNGQVEPQDGDIVELSYLRKVTASSSVTIKKRFRLTPVNNGHEPSWRYSDPFQTIVRCHTQQISQSDLTSITVTPQLLTDATVGVAYSAQMTATGGLESYTWLALNLPPGLTISSGGLITGIPTLTGAYTPLITATDSVADSGSATCSLTVH